MLTGEPLYLLDRNEQALLRYVYNEEFRGYVPVPCDLMLDDLKIARPWLHEQ